MRIAIIALSALVLSGCANTAVIRIVEYDLRWFGKGVAVHQSGKENAFAQVEILYRGEDVTVAIRDDRGAAIETEEEPDAVPD